MFELGDAWRGGLGQGSGALAGSGPLPSLSSSVRETPGQEIQSEVPIPAPHYPAVGPWTSELIN